MSTHSDAHAPESSAAVTAEAALAEFYQRRDAGEAVDAEAFLAQYPHLADELRAALETVELVDQIFEFESGSAAGSSIDSWAGGDDVERAPVAERLDQPIPLQTYIEHLLELELIDAPTLATALEKYQRGLNTRGEAAGFGSSLVEQGVLTGWQHERLLVGQANHLLLHHYLLLDHLGSGGMGAVYLAEHKLMRRRVAIKVLPPKRLKKQSSLSRFVREAQAVAALDHPNIVKAFSIDNWGDVHYLVMEYVQGVDLSRKVRRNGPLDPRAAAEYIRQAAAGLQHAHAQGIIHRDIKPSNLLLDDQGTVKILDMGLALCLGGSEPSTTLEHSERTIGTADYMAPEQARDSHHVDPRVDVYSLGCTMYFLLAARVPFPEGTLAERLLDHQLRDAPDLRELRSAVPESLAAICRRMMAKRAAERFQSAEEVAQALAAWLDPRSVAEGTTETAPQFAPQRLDRVRKPRQTQIWPFAAAAVAVLGVIGLVVWATSPGDVEQREPAGSRTFVDDNIEWHPDVPVIAPVSAAQPAVIAVAQVDDPQKSSSIYQDVPVIAQHVYRGEVSVSTTDLTRPGNVILKFYDVSGGGLVQTELQNSDRPVKTTSWTRYAVSARAPPGAVKARLFVHFGSRSRGTVRLGAAALTDGSGPNLLVNGDFIQGLESWRVYGAAQVRVSADQPGEPE